MRLPHYTIVLIVLWCLFAAFAQPSAYWRDSGEFILAATYLDVGHPAGFPLFGQLANLFALIPIGPLAFRVNAFCAFTAALFLTLSYVSAIETLKSFSPKVSSLTKILCAAAPVFFMLGSPTLLKRSATAEMYLLDGSLVAVLYLLALQWHRTRDARYLLSIGFAAGLSLCNHAPIGLVLLLATIVVAWSARAVLLPLLLPAALCGALGLATYAYLPARSLANPPLNTGGAGNTRGFMLQVTDGRDRILRKSAVHNDINVVKMIPAFSVLERQIISAGRVLSRDLSPIFVIACGVGIFSLFLITPYCAFLLAAIASGNWYFFQSWDPDPWMPLFFAMAVAAATACAAISRREKYAGLFSSCAFCGFGILHALNPHNLSMLQALSSYETPAEVARQTLEPVPHGVPFISETSWFYLKYARDIEGVREDVPLLYQPAILYSGFFAGRDLRLPSGDELAVKPNFTSIPQFDEAGHLISRIAAERPIYFEAGAMNAFLSKVARFDASGGLQLAQGQPTQYSDGFAESILRMTAAVTSQPLMAFNATRGDTRFFAELKVVTTAELLAASGRTGNAAQLIEEFCAPLVTSSCGQEALNNLGTYKMNLGDFAGAEHIFSALLQRGASQTAVIEQNLAQARQQQLEKK